MGGGANIIGGPLIVWDSQFFLYYIFTYLEYIISLPWIIKNFGGPV